MSASTSSKQLGHMVYFTLKDNSAAAVSKMLSECTKYLTDHPGTVFFGVGTCDRELNREVNVLDYDIALQLIFKDRAAHDVYQVAPRHLEFIAANKENWAKVRVFDANLTT